MHTVQVKTVLITGAAGFIGSHLADACVARGDNVRAVDDFSTGRRQNLAQSGSRLRLHDISLLDRVALLEVCNGVDIVYHLAALPSVSRSIIDPRTSHRSNVDGTFELLEAARQSGVKRVIYSASSSVYGNQPGFPRTETMLPQPVSPYAVQKFTGELYLQSYWRVYGLETVCLRYFNIFGPRQDASSQYSGVIATFVTCLLRGEVPTIYGDGEQSRDFTYVENAVQANLLAADASSAQVAGRVFNIASGNPHTINQTYEAIAGLLQSDLQPVHAPERPGDVKKSYADISAAALAFGYRPAISFEQGLSQTVRWYARQLSASEG